MSTGTLFDALRADLQRKFMTIRSLGDVNDAFAVLGSALDALCLTVDATLGEVSDGTGRRKLASDLMAIDTLTKEMAARLNAHALALNNGMFASSTDPTA